MIRAAMAVLILAPLFPVHALTAEPCPDFKDRPGQLECLAAAQAKIDREIRDAHARALESVRGQASRVPPAANSVDGQLNYKARPVADVLKRAQAHWLSYRDDQCNAQASACSGTICGVIHGRCLYRISEARLRDLEDLMQLGR
jgi:uncharacterized protein YecT (DUF1311 family)